MLNYCKNIATAVFNFLDRVLTSLMELVISVSKMSLIREMPPMCVLQLSEELLLRREQEEPEWLTKLQQLREDRTAPCSSSDDQKKFVQEESVQSDDLVFDPLAHSTLQSTQTTVNIPEFFLCCLFK